MHVVEAGQPWEQRADESEDAYLAFIRWLHKGDRRGIPSETGWARRYKWAERAKAFDTKTSMPRTDKERLEFTLRNVLNLVFLESNKLVRKAMVVDDLVVSAREMVALIQLLQDRESKDIIRKYLEDDEKVDLSQLSDDDLQTVKRLKAAFRKGA